MGGRYRRAFVVAGALTVLVAGCGGSKPISKAELVKKGDARCAADNKRIKAIPQPGFNPLMITKAQLPEAARYLGKINPIEKSELDYLRGLGEPTQGKKQWDRILQGAQAVVSDLGDAEQAAKDGDVAKFKAAFRKLTANDANRLAAQFGFKACGQG